MGTILLYFIFLTGATPAITTGSALYYHPEKCKEAAQAMQDTNTDEKITIKNVCIAQTDSVNEYGWMHNYSVLVYWVHSDGAVTSGNSTYTTMHDCLNAQQALAQVQLPEGVTVTSTCNEAEYYKSPV
jgi:hypothetical protein